MTLEHAQSGSKDQNVQVIRRKKYFLPSSWAHTRSCMIVYQVIETGKAKTLNFEGNQNWKLIDAWTKTSKAITEWQSQLPRNKNKMLSFLVLNMVRSRVDGGSGFLQGGKVSGGEQGQRSGHAHGVRQMARHSLRKKKNTPWDNRVVQSRGQNHDWSTHWYVNHTIIKMKRGDI